MFPVLVVVAGGFVVEGCSTTSTRPKVTGKKTEPVEIHATRAEIDYEEVEFGQPGLVRVICRWDHPTGSHQYVPMCFTVEMIERNSKEARRWLQRIQDVAGMTRRLAVPQPTNPGGVR